jgi:hypothetical protein
MPPSRLADTGFKPGRSIANTFRIASLRLKGRWPDTASGRLWGVGPPPSSLPRMVGTCGPVPRKASRCSWTALRADKEGNGAHVPQSWAPPLLAPNRRHARGLRGSASSIGNLNVNLSVFGNGEVGTLGRKENFATIWGRIIERGGHQAGGDDHARTHEQENGLLATIPVDTTGSVPCTRSFQSVSLPAAPRYLGSPMPATLVWERTHVGTALRKFDLKAVKN